MRKVVIISSTVLLSILNGCSAGSVTLSIKTPIPELPIKVASDSSVSKQLELPLEPISPTTPVSITGTIETLNQLKMLTLEEMPLEAEVILSNGQRSNNLIFENKTPQLISLKNNIVIANEPGTGEVVIRSTDFPEIETQITIQIERSNIAVIDLEIDFE